MHHQESGVHDALTVGRHIREAVHRLVDRGVGVDISTEIDTYRLEIIDDSFSREVLRSVERHVLQEVRQTVLVILLEDSAYRLRDMELGTLFRLLVMTDVIGQSVIQLTVTDLRIHRHFLRRFLRRDHHRCYQQREG